MHVPRRPDQDREDNEAAVNGYADGLQAIFEDWLNHSKRSGVSIQGLTSRLQDAARRSFSAAFLRGKRQAWPESDLSIEDRLWIEQALARNQDGLENSLGGDIRTKVLLQQLDRGPELDALRQSFLSRIRNLYGGMVWQVTEAGYRSGLQDLFAYVRQRRQEERGVGPLYLESKQQRRGFLDRLAARALGVVQSVWNAILGNPQPARLGIKYNTQHDKNVCDYCNGAGHGGQAADGVYWSPELPPLPGEVCRGLANCRCWLSPIVGEAM